MSENINTELGVDAGEPVYADAKAIKKAQKEAKKAAKKAEKEAKKAEKRHAKAEKAINKSIAKCQKEVTKASKEKDPIKRQKKIEKAKAKLEKRINKTTEKYPVEAKAVLEEKERAAAATKLRNKARAQQPARAFDGTSRAYDTPDNSKPTPAPSMEAAQNNMPGQERSNTGDPLVDLFTDLILAVVDEMKKRQIAFEKRLREREEEKLLAQNKTRSSSGQETDALTQTGNQNTNTSQTPSLAMIYRNNQRQGMV